MNGYLHLPSPPVETLLEQIEQGAGALAEQVKGWLPAGPSRAELAGAQRAAVGLGRLMSDLAVRMEDSP